MSIDFSLPCFLGVIFQNVLAIVNPSYDAVSVFPSYVSISGSLRSKTVVLIPSTSYSKLNLPVLKAFAIAFHVIAGNK
jgi:hypothetical protein